MVDLFCHSLQIQTNRNPHWIVGMGKNLSSQQGKNQHASEHSCLTYLVFHLLIQHRHMIQDDVINITEYLPTMDISNDL